MNSLRKVGISLFLLSNLAAGSGVLFAEDLLPQNTESVESHVILKAPIAGESDKPAVYDLKRWVVEKDTDPVARALEVYKKRSEPRHNRRIWLTGKTDGKKRLIVEDAALGENDKIIFSPDENYMYYLGLAPGGQSIVYGVNLASNEKFSLGSGEDFQAVNCPDKESYVVVQPDGQGTIYQVYTTNGERMETLTDLTSPLDLEKNLCRY